MFRILNNIDNQLVGSSGNINVSFRSIKKVNNVYVFDVGTNDQFPIHSGITIIIKVDLRDDSFLGMFADPAQLLSISGIFSGSTVKIYKLNSNPDYLQWNNPTALMDHFTQTDQYLIERKRISGTSQGPTTINFDVSKAFSNASHTGNATLYYAITNDIPSSANAVFLGLDAFRSFYIYNYNYLGVNPVHEFHKYSCSKFDCAYLDTVNGKLSFILDFFKTSSKKLAMSVPLAFSENNTPNYFINKFRFAFEWVIRSVGTNCYSVIDATGQENVYEIIDRSPSDIAYQLREKNILHNDEYVDDNHTYNLFYCQETGSYFYIEDNSTIYHYDQNDNKTIFTYVNQSVGFHIYSYVTKQGDSISYQYDSSTNKISSISNSDGESISFDYSSNTYQLVVLFDNLERKVCFNETSNGLDAHFFNTHYRIPILINKYEISISNGQITDIAQYDTDNNQMCHFYISRSGGTKVRDIYRYTEGYNEVAHYQYAYDNNQLYTKYINPVNILTVLYFDKYGRLKATFDSTGNVETSNYFDISSNSGSSPTGERKTYNASRTLIENNSFEYFESGLPRDWSISGNANAIQASSDSLFGPKCLFINTASGETVHLYQKIDNIPQGNNYRFSVYLKKVNSASVYICVVTTENGNPVTHTLDLTNLSNYWDEYYIDDIEVDSFSSAEIYIDISASSSIYIDDISFTNKEQNIRFNLVKNGHLEKIDSSTGLPSYFIVENAPNTAVVEISGDDLHQSILGKNTFHIPNFVSSSFAVKKIFQNIAFAPKKGTGFTFSILTKGYANKNDVFRVFITFVHQDISLEDKTYYYDFEKNQPNWQVLSASFKINDDYDSIIFGVEYDGNEEVYFDAFELYRDYCLNYYEYDNAGKLSSFNSASGAQININKVDGLASSIQNIDGSFYKIDYESNRIKKIMDLYGDYIDYNYNSITEYLTSFSIHHANSVITTNITYDNNGNITSTDDSMYDFISYDIFNRPTIIEHLNGLVITKYYDALDNVIFVDASYNNISITHNDITYDYQFEVETNISSGTITHDFVYDEYGRLTAYKAGNLNAQLNTYNSMEEICGKGLPATKKYVLSSGNKFYSFIYDENSLVTEIQYDGDTITRYRYNELFDLSVVEDVQNNIKKFYAYTLKGHIYKYTCQDLLIKYQYDSLDNIQEKNIKIGSYKRIVYNNHYYEKKTYSKDAFFKLLTNNYDDDIIFASNKGYGSHGAIYKSKGCDISLETGTGLDVFDFNDVDDALCYDFESFNQYRTSSNNNGKNFSLESWRKDFDYSKTFYFVFKPTGSINTNEHINLFNLTYPSLQKKLMFNIYSNSTKLEFDNGDNLITLGTVIINNWNVVKLSIYRDGSNITRFHISLNGQDYGSALTGLSTNLFKEFIIYENSADVSLLTSSEPTPTPLSLQVKIPFIGVSTKRYSKEEMNDLLVGFKRVFITNVSSNNESNNIVSFNNSLFLDFDYLSFNDTFKSIDNFDPINNCEKKTSFNPYKISPFVYLNELKRFVLKFEDGDAFETPIYNFNLNNELCLSMWINIFEPDQSTGDRYLCSVFNDNSGLLSVYINTNGHLVLKVGNIDYSTNIEIHEYVWSHIFIDIKNTGAVKLRINGVQSLNLSLSPIDFTGSKISFGAKEDNTNKIHGYLDSILISKTSHTYGDNFLNYSRPIAVEEEKDFAGRTINKSIILPNENKYQSTYTYDRYKISNESLFAFNNSGYLESLDYDYDDIGNIVEISSNGNTLKEYEYDKLSHLTSHKNHVDSYEESFTYDSEGNILTYQKLVNNTPSLSYVYNYDSRGILQNVKQGNTIVYSASGEYPTYLNLQGSVKYPRWQGKRLTGLSTSINPSITPSIRYYYNEEGIRIKKITPSETTTYVLEGKKILRMNKVVNNTTHTFDFIYDINNSLVGLSYKNKDYFYVKNAIGEIIGIVNSSGNYIVNYSYTAFGLPTINMVSGISLDETKVVLHNPYLYKSYYYDNETGFYYLNSRYYVPLIMRFFSIDDPNYLDKDDVRGINQFSYCRNNPIMYEDPDGNLIILPILIAGVIGAVMGAGFGACAGALSAAYSGRDIWTGIWIGALSGGIMGLGSGLGGYFLAPLVLCEEISIGALAGGFATAAGLGGIGAGLGELLTQKVADEKEEIDWGQLGFSVVMGAMLNVANALIGGFDGRLQLNSSSILTSICLTSFANSTTTTVQAIIDVLRYFL